MALTAFDGEGNVVKFGDEVTDFRGNRASFCLATRARTDGKSGKVVVSPIGKLGQQEYYDKVFDLHVKDV